jgi:peptidoglycan/LPS O-acetylase OafA/YrhL
MFVRLSYLRLALAVSVAAYHLWKPAVPQAGPLAVFGFYFISGFLISNLLTGLYRDRTGAFLANRFLRIYPTYWACAAVALCVVLSIPEEASRANSHMFLPETAHQVFANLAVFGLLREKGAVLAPPAWSLNLELIWYGLLLFAFRALPAGMRTKTLLALLPMPILFAACDIEFYKSVIGAGYAFALGALYQETEPTIPRWAERAALAAMPIMMFVLPPMFGLSGKDQLISGASLNLYLFPFVVFVGFGFFLRTKGENRAAYWSGVLSYPFFLIHWPMAAIGLAFGFERYSIEFVAFGLFAAFLASVVVVLLVETPLNTMRVAIRGRSNQQPNAVSRPLTDLASSH